MRRLIPYPMFGLLVGGIVFGLAGCSGGVHTDVTGKVTYNGQPLPKPGGMIVFVGPDGSQTATPIEVNGSYTAKSVPTGVSHIAVYYPNAAVTNAKPEKKPPKKPEKAAATTPPPVVSTFLTPDKYAVVDTSGLSVEIAEGTVFNADLTGPKIP